MSNDPILIIQAQRLGDLVLTFPLFHWLQQRDRPIHVVAEKSFYDALLPIAPKVIFLPMDAIDHLKAFNYQQIINLSSRHEAIEITLALKDTCTNILGIYNDGSTTRIAGAWQLYRHSLIHNNNYNTFHWADINALDLIPLTSISKTIWPMPIRKTTRRIGLFVGASEKAKRPSAEFWADLATDLNRRGYSPIFLGGRGEEEEIGRKAASLAQMPVVNMCGRFTINELLVFMQELDLLVCPDTGPMHVASFSQTLCLNLSLGPVSAWETGPRPPNHYVLRSNISCAPCWKCHKDEQECHTYFIPNRIGNLIHCILREKTPPNIPELELCKTSQTQDGLYTLESLENTPPNTLRTFWHHFFLYILQRTTAQATIKVNDLEQTSEQLFMSAQCLKKDSPEIYRELQTATNLLQKDMISISCSEQFWMNRSPYIRPFTGFCWTLAENYDLSKDAIATIIAYTQFLHTLLQE